MLDTLEEGGVDGWEWEQQDRNGRTGRTPAFSQFLGLPSCSAMKRSLGRAAARTIGTRKERKMQVVRMEKKMLIVRDFIVIDGCVIEFVGSKSECEEAIYREQ